MAVAAAAIEDAASFTSMLHDYFKDLPGDSCREFLDIMKDFTENTCSTTEVLQRVEELMKDHPRLCTAFNALMPPDPEWRIDVPSQSTRCEDLDNDEPWGLDTPSSEMTMDEAFVCYRDPYSEDCEDLTDLDTGFPISPTSVAGEADFSGKLLKPGKGEVQLVHINIHTSQLHRHMQDMQYYGTKKGLNPKDEKKRSSREMMRTMRPKIDSLPLPEVSVMSPELLELKQRIELAVQKVNSTKHRHRKGGPCPRCQVENQLRAAKRAYHKRATVQAKSASPRGVQRRKLTVDTIDRSTHLSPSITTCPTKNASSRQPSSLADGSVQLSASTVILDEKEIAAAPLQDMCLPEPDGTVERDA